MPSGDDESTVPDSAGDVDARDGGTIGRFAVDSTLGAGGMGVVYAAHDPVLDRRVAIKLIRPGGDDADGEVRLLREGQAMARLAHPNVVTVHECGVAGGSVYVVMELVDGTTLRDWLTTPRPWRDVVGVFVAAGRGLAAAHEAGMVHRDFKPGNVMLDRAGTAKVGDFGLVGVAGTPGRDGAAAAAASPTALTTPLTRTGEVMGTPAYIAPEQERGADVDARADQYSFCKSLGEALTAGGTREMPARLRPIVARGLAEDPADRYPAMAPLIADLERTLRRRRGWIAAAGVGAIAVTAAAITAATAGGASASSCAAVEHRLDGVWDAARRDPIRAHLIAIDPAQGASRFTAAAGVLDDYAADWTAMATTACRANRARTESDALYDARTRCLDRRRGELAAAAGALAAAKDLAASDRAVEQVRDVIELAACADADALLALVPPPDDPAIRREVDAVSAEIDSIQAGRSAGIDAGLLARATALEARARATGYGPALGAALEIHADLLFDADTPTPGIPLLRELTEVAATAHDDRLASWAWSKLLLVVGGYQHKVDEAIALLPAGRAALARAPVDLQLRVIYLFSEASVLGAAQQLDEAQARIKDGMAILMATGTLHPSARLASWLGNLVFLSGTLYGLAGQYDAAVTALRGAIEFERATFGADHPRIAFTWHNLGEALRFAGKLDESIAAYREAIRIREARLGPDSVALAGSLTSLATALVAADKIDEAEPINDRAIRILRAAGSPDVSSATMTQAVILDARGKPDQARAAYGETIATLEGIGGQDINLPMTYFNRGELAERESHYDDALPDYQRALDLFVEYVGAEHPQLVYPLDALGRCLVKRGRPDQAIPYLDRAIALEPVAGEPVLVAQARFYRGLALVESGRDRAGGTKAARAAIAELAALGDDAAGELLEANAWWKQRRAR